MNKLHTINAEDLQSRTYEPTHFLVDELIPEGLHILAGAPKIGWHYGSAYALRRGSRCGILRRRKARFCISVSKIRSSVSRHGSLT